MKNDSKVKKCPELKTLVQAREYVAYLTAEDRWPAVGAEAERLWGRLIDLGFEFSPDGVRAWEKSILAMKLTDHLVSHSTSGDAGLGTLVNVLVAYPWSRSPPVIAHLFAELDRVTEVMKSACSSNTQHVIRLVKALPMLWSGHKDRIIKALHVVSYGQWLEEFLGLEQLTQDDRDCILMSLVNDCASASLAQGSHDHFKNLLIIIRNHASVERKSAFNGLIADAARAVARKELQNIDERDVTSDYLSGNASWDEMTLYVDDTKGYQDMLRRQQEMRRMMYKMGPFGTFR